MRLVVILIAMVIVAWILSSRSRTFETFDDDIEDDDAYVEEGGGDDDDA